MKFCAAVVAALLAVVPLGSALPNHNPLGRQATTDTCANLHNVPVFATVDGFPFWVGTINQCICTSEVSTYLDTDITGIALLVLEGRAAATAEIDGLISSAANAHVCPRGPNQEAACSPSNVCDFTCTHHFTKSGGSCVCELPRTEHNGMCTLSGSPGLRKRDLRQTGCGPREMACGVPGIPDQWECIDTSRSLDSCGGCIYPPPKSLVSAFDRFVLGEDCTDLAHVADVSCQDSKCVIGRCQEPYTLNADRSACGRPAVVPAYLLFNGGI